MKDDVEYIINILILQLLIKIDKDGVMKMHDQLWDMDRKIVVMKIEYKEIQIWNMNEEVLDGISEKIIDLTII